jgi:hypothetical protein
MMVGGVSYVSKQSSMTCNMPASFWVLQPQLMHDYLEHEACSYPTGCAIMSGAYLMCHAVHNMGRVWPSQGTAVCCAAWADICCLLVAPVHDAFDA